MFAEIIELIHYKEVTYYSILLDGDKESLFHQFVNKMLEKRLNEDLAILKSFLEKVGNKYGAKKQYFRFENTADALPPNFVSTKHNLRLYCMRINENSVILFNGGMKTKSTSQESPEVSMHFHDANIYSQKI